MATIEVSMTKLHHHLSHYVELARAGNVVVVVNKLRKRVECCLVAHAPACAVEEGGKPVAEQAITEER